MMRTFFEAHKQKIGTEETERGDSTHRLPMRKAPSGNGPQRRIPRRAPARESPLEGTHLRHGRHPQSWLAHPAAAQNDDRRHDDRFSNHARCREDQNQRPVVVIQQPFHVDEEADGCEEQCEEDRLEGLDVRAKLTGEVGSSEDDARDERTQFRGESDGVTRPGRGECRGECDDHGEVPVPPEYLGPEESGQKDDRERDEAKHSEEHG